MDQETHEDYKTMSGSKVYGDANKSSILDPDTLYQHDSYYTSGRDHVIHCILIWRKQHRMYQSGGNIDTLVGSYGHTKHCASTLLKYALADPHYLDRIVTRTISGYVDCTITTQQDRTSLQATADAVPY